MNTKRQRDSSKQNIKQFLTTSAHYQEVNPTSVRKESQYLRSQEQKELQMPQSGIPMNLQATSVKEDLKANICHPCRHSASIQCHIS